MALLVLGLAHGAASGVKKQAQIAHRRAAFTNSFGAGAQAFAPLQASPAANPLSGSPIKLHRYVDA